MKLDSLIFLRFVDVISHIAATTVENTDTHASLLLLHVSVDPICCLGRSFCSY